MKKLDEESITKIKGLRMSGLSIKQIVGDTGFAVATVSKYCRGLRPNNKNKINLTNLKKASLTYRDNCLKRIEDCKNRALSEWPNISDDTKKLIAFYWAEGSKRGKGNTGAFEITNSDPGILKFCVGEIRKLCDNKITAYLSIYPEQDSHLCTDKWEEFIGIRPRVRIKQWRRDSKKRKLYSKYGVCSIYVHKSFDLWHSMMTWIDCWRSEIGIDDSCQL